MPQNHISPIVESPDMQACVPWFQEQETTLYLGDSLKIMEQLPAGSADMIFVDPPYKLSNNGVTCQGGKRVSVNKGKWDQSEGFEKDMEFHEKWISAANRLLDKSGTIWISGTHHSIYQCGYLLLKMGFRILNDIAWYKPNAAPNLSCTTFAHSHETLLWAKKSKDARNTFNYEKMKTGHFPKDPIKKENKQMRSVWFVPTPSSKEKTFGKHPTQKPLALLRRIILSSTKEGDTILDPFNGSGTTAVASQMIGNRKYIGIELETSYLEVTVKRLSHPLPKSVKTLDNDDKTRSLVY